MQIFTVALCYGLGAPKGYHAAAVDRHKRVNVLNDILFHHVGPGHWQNTTLLKLYTVTPMKLLVSLLTVKTSSSAMAETAQSLRRFRLTSIVIHKIMHKIAFLGHPMCASGAM